jgi:hypothetical protein
MTFDETVPLSIIAISDVALPLDMSQAGDSGRSQHRVRNSMEGLTNTQGRYLQHELLLPQTLLSFSRTVFRVTRADSESQLGNIPTRINRGSKVVLVNWPSCNIDPMIFYLKPKLPGLGPNRPL